MGKYAVGGIDQLELTDGVLAPEVDNDIDLGSVSKKYKDAYVKGLFTFGMTTGITAFATGGQADAVALTTTYNNVTTCSTAGDSVKLPAAAVGLVVVVKNSGAAALDVFPASSDSIDALGVNLAVRVLPGSTVAFMAKDSIVWESTTDVSITLNSPTTVKGQLEIRCADSAGNTVTTIVNASQAAARTYTVPDNGRSSEFSMFANTTATATADGLTTGLLTGRNQFVTVTSASADNIVALPSTSTLTIGDKIRGFVGTNGCEIRANATETVTVNGVTSTNADVEAAIAANTFFEATFAATGIWFLTTVNGTTIAAPTPDGV